MINSHKNKSSTNRRCKTKRIPRSQPTTTTTTAATTATTTHCHQEMIDEPPPPPPSSPPPPPPPSSPPPPPPSSTNDGRNKPEHYRDIPRQKNSPDNDNEAKITLKSTPVALLSVTRPPPPPLHPSPLPPASFEIFTSTRPEQHKGLGTVLSDPGGRCKGRPGGYPRVYVTGHPG